MTQAKNILALDMAYGEIAICVLRGDDVFLTQAKSVQENAGKMRSTAIIPLMAEVLSQADLDWQQLDALALGVGPGSFTGLRIAAATLAGVNSALKLPIISLSSLAISARQTNTDAPVWVLEDARAGEVFVGSYQRSHSLQEDICLRWDDVAAMDSASYCCHANPPLALSGWDRLPLSLSRSEALALETQQAAQQSGDGAMFYPVPVYLQLSQAERSAGVRV